MILYRLLPTTESLRNLSLQEERLAALFCSVRCPGDPNLKTYELARIMRDAEMPVIRGFQAQMEEECLHLLLRGSQPVVMCSDRSIGRMRIPVDWRPALGENQLFVLFPFPEHQRLPTAETTEQRNNLVADLASQVFLAHAAPGGKSEAFASRLAAIGKPILTLDSPANENRISSSARPSKGTEHRPALIVAHWTVGWNFNGLRNALTSDRD